MKLSKRCEYGIKAAVQLAQRHGSGYTQSREIASAEALPAKFLESILLALRSASILESKVGAGGGYRLARAPNAIRVTELISALEKADAEDVAPATSNGDSTGAPASGQRAIDDLNHRLDQAFMQALGALTLFDIARVPANSATQSGNGSIDHRAARTTAQPMSA